MGNNQNKLERKYGSLPEQAFPRYRIDRSSLRKSNREAKKKKTRGLSKSTDQLNSNDVTFLETTNNDQISNFQEFHSQGLARSSIRKSNRESKRKKTRGLSKSTQQLSNNDTGLTFVETAFLPEYPISGTGYGQLSDFKVVEVASKGAFGDVLKVLRPKDQNYYAMKIMKKGKLIKEGAIMQSKYEAMLQESVGHYPFIVKPYWFFQDLHNVYIVMEYMSRGDLFVTWKQQQTFSEDLVRIYIAELAMTIDYLHQFGVIYRDIKMENIVLDAHGHVQLVDFGLAKKLKRRERTKTVCGTLQYIGTVKSFNQILLAAPEVVMMLVYDHSVDWWSLGILMYALLVGDFPVKGAKDHFDMANKMKYHSYDLPEDDSFSPEARDCVQGLLQKASANRVRDLKTLQRLPFFQNLNFGRLFNRQISPLKYLEMHDDKLGIDPFSSNNSDTVLNQSFATPGSLDEDLDDLFINNTSFDQSLDDLSADPACIEHQWRDPIARSASAADILDNTSFRNQRLQVYESSARSASVAGFLDDFSAGKANVAGASISDSTYNKSEKVAGGLNDPHTNNSRMEDEPIRAINNSKSKFPGEFPVTNVSFSESRSESSTVYNKRLSPHHQSAAERDTLNESRNNSRPAITEGRVHPPVSQYLTNQRNSYMKKISVTERLNDLFSKSQTHIEDHNHSPVIDTSVVGRLNHSFDIATPIPKSESERSRCLRERPDDAPRCTVPLHSSPYVRGRVNDTFDNTSRSSGDSQRSLSVRNELNNSFETNRSVPADDDVFQRSPCMMATLNDSFDKTISHPGSAGDHHRSPFVRRRSNDSVDKYNKPRAAGYDSQRSPTVRDRLNSSVDSSSITRGTAADLPRKLKPRRKLEQAFNLSTNESCKSSFGRGNQDEVGSDNTLIVPHREARCRITDDLQNISNDCNNSYIRSDSAAAGQGQSVDVVEKDREQQLMHHISSTADLDDSFFTLGDSDYAWEQSVVSLDGIVV